MCRHVGYVGTPIPVGELLTRGTHSLRTQAWAPRDMRGGGAINADGFGVAWWRPGPDVPIASRYRNPAPIWTDPAVEEVLPQLESTAVLGSVRSATVGMPIERAACAPFTDGRWAFSHNGSIPGWRRVLTAVLADLDIAATQFGLAQQFETIQLLDAESATDAATLWVLLRQLLAAITPDGFVQTPAMALRLLVTAVLAHEPKARLTLLLGDGEQLYATTVHHGLSALITDSFAVLSSEPYDDDPGWQPIANHALLTARPGGLSVDSLSVKGHSR